MSTSVGTKARKKQPSSDIPPTQDAVPVTGRQFENAVLALENACVRVLESRFANGRRDTERLYWQQRFKNIATPVSLALAESKGPRRFHYHYRHRPEDESVLQPVMENPMDTLAQVCKYSLKLCQSDLVGIEDDAILETRDLLETALGNFLSVYLEYKMKAA